MNNHNKFTFLVTEDKYSKIRLDKWLAVELVSLTRSHVVHLIDKGLVNVNNKAVKSSYVIRLNDVIEVNIPEIKNSETLIPLNAPLSIHYEDDDLVVINKPSGLVVHPAAGHEQDTLVNILIYHIKNLSMKNENRPGIVHRIDKETSGLLVVAKNDFTHDKLSEQFKNKTTHRLYYAITEGLFKKKKDTLASYLVRHQTDRKKYASLKLNNQIIRKKDESVQIGKWAVTEYQILKTQSKLNLIQLKLETGRTHQIRVHLSDIGHPILGDITYGYSVKKNHENKLNRFYLHAAELGFVHPRSLKLMKFSVPWPEKDQEQIAAWGLNV